MSSRLRLVGGLAFSSFLIVGCAVAPAEGVDDQQPVQVDPETDTVQPMQPNNPCTPVYNQTVDGTTGTTGASTGGCDWFVVTKSNLGNNNWALRVRATSPGTQGIVVAGTALCEDSWVQAMAYGLTAPHWEYVGGSPVWDPGGDWEYLGSKTEYGVVLGGTCHFPGPEQYCGLGGCSGIPVYNNPASPNYHPMTTVLIATRSKIYATTGTKYLAQTGYTVQIW